ncbi:hypothetical protein [Aliivibrio fischeri]|uniref:hypothetical protein n=1 Tax=Aliivibrio fischeri TaxID=668 RepID=UPI00080E1855|nr:hypothetical protein [Aliivibrio fischeri]OCH40666.1 hypothetical protein A6E02_04915 [Aliivibrio fischeri]
MIKIQLPLNAIDAFYTDLNLLSHPFVDIKHNELLIAAESQPQIGVYILTYSDGNIEVPLMVGRATKFKDHLYYILSKFRETAKADYKNRFVAEQIALKYGKAIPLNLFWLPCSESELLQEEKRITKVCNPIYGSASARTYCNALDMPKIIFEPLN